MNTFYVNKLPKCQHESKLVQLNNKKVGWTLHVLLETKTGL